MTSAVSSTVAEGESRAIKNVSYKFETPDGISKFEWLIFPKKDNLVGLKQTEAQLRRRSRMQSYGHPRQQLAEASDILRTMH
ncbi:hypothetical protein BTUL_0064g00380 [Botrytis tulipae]|uniref:Uncharacterized protein n=1 Tax=Botrytis tulipae TaxID=87230 RepID=A0A4Z1EY24_9HELO|nr:hypothetical protein BTUL_0064g00380 [Botrytis tulipae]